MKTQYIGMTFEDACKVKWDAGVKEYRKKSTDPFNGEHCEEAFQECIDLYNILGDMEKRHGVSMNIQRSMAKQIATTLQAQHKRLAGQ